MANTIKFGNGQWATKEDSILAYNDENANFKPLPFVTSRASTATTVNKAGLLETVASGVPRVDYLDNSKGSYLIEPSSTNLITQSESFGNSYWTKSGATIEGDASTAGSEQVVNGNFATDTDWTKGTGWSIVGGVASCDGTQTGNTNLSEGGVFSSLANKMVKITFTVSNYSAGSVRFISGNGALSHISVSNNGEVVLYFDIASNSGTSFNIQGDVDFIGSVDNVSAKEVQGFSAPSVDSPLSAFKLVEDTSTGQHRMFLSATITTTTLTDYTSSIYVKRGGRYKFQIANKNESIYASYDLSDGTLLDESGVTSSIVALVSDWYRIDIKQNYSGTSNGFAIYVLDDDYTSGYTDSYTGDGTSGFYIFGAQLEQHSYATSYIPTKGSQISRLAESAHLGDLNAKGLINDSAIVLYLENDIQSNTVNQFKQFVSLYNDAFKSFRLETRIDNRVYIQQSGLITSGDNFNSFSLGANSVNFKKIAVYLTTTQFKVFADGVQIGATLNGAYVLDFDNIGFMEYNQTVEAVIKSKDLRIYNTSLSDSELTTLTTI